MPPTIYQFVDSGSFLEAVLCEKRKRNPGFSLRSWARQIGLQHPMTLSRVLRKQRKLPVELVQKIAKQLKMPKEELEYWQLLSLAENAKSTEEKARHLDDLRTLAPLPTQEIDDDSFQFISHWYYPAIVELAQLKNASLTPEAIVRWLGGGMTIPTAQQAIERLLRLGFLIKNPEGRLERGKHGQLKTGDRGRSLAIQQYHRQMLDKAQSALTDLGLEKRDYTANTLALDRQSVEKIKKYIRRLHREAAKHSAQGEGEALYQLNVQLFQLSENKI
jgi:uncharacterized protein (TIGR02147 family)